MRTRLIAVVMALGAWAVPTAAAEPVPLPDLSGYTAADPNDFGKYYNYPTTYGLNFAAPGGYRCRIAYTYKANPNVKTVACWGDLPGTATNAVGVTLDMESGPAEFKNVDLAAMEKYHNPPPDVTSIHTVDPDSYKPLPVGSKLTLSGSATCAAGDAMTVCVLGDHGFVLEPQGSQAF